MESRSTGYRYISPLLECEPYKDGLQEIRPFKRLVVRRVNELLSSGYVEHLSVYFRDMNNGPWFGINEKEQFAPASLLKVPIMFAYFKWAETEPSVLTRMLKADAINDIQAIGPAKKVARGESLPVLRLIERMIVYSDNNAALTLLENLPKERLNTVYTGLGLTVPESQEESVGEQGENIVNVRDYAAFFRILYNASYLTRESSEKALGFLAQVDFKDGLVAGVPGGVPVAHKFGERRRRSGTIQLHDCGIVYGKKPYLLCVMSRGTDMGKLAAAIRDISKLAYSESQK
ncbi:MAG: serine hydrolase [Elusimicrobiota bacterium]|jgi:beta-lactamase class A